MSTNGLPATKGKRDRLLDVRSIAYCHFLGKCTHDMVLLEIDRARRALDKAQTLSDAKDIADRAATVAEYAERVKCSAAVVNQAIELKIRAEALAGQMLHQTPKQDGGDAMKARSKATTEVLPPKLSDLGVTKDFSSRAQRLGSDPVKLDAALQAQKAAGKKISAAGTLRLMDPKPKRTDHPEARHQNVETKTLINLGKFEDLQIGVDRYDRVTIRQGSGYSISTDRATLQQIWAVVTNHYSKKTVALEPAESVGASGGRELAGVLDADGGAK